MANISERLSKILAIPNKEPKPLSNLGRPGHCAQGGRASRTHEWDSTIPQSPNAIVKSCGVDDVGKSLNHDLSGVTARYMKHTCSTLLKRKARTTKDAVPRDDIRKTFNMAFAQRHRSDAWATKLHGKSYETPALRQRMAERGVTEATVQEADEVQEGNMHSTTRSMGRSVSCNESSILDDAMEMNALRRTLSHAAHETPKSTLELVWEDGPVSVTCSIPVDNGSTAAEVLKSLTDSTAPAITKQGSVQVVIDFSYTGDSVAPVQLELSAAEKHAGWSTEVELEDIEVEVHNFPSSPDWRNIERESLAGARGTSAEVSELAKIDLTYAGVEGPVKVELKACDEGTSDPRGNAGVIADEEKSGPSGTAPSPKAERPDFGVISPVPAIEIKDARFHEERPPLRHIQTGKAPAETEITADDSGNTRCQNAPSPQTKRRSKPKKLLSKFLCRGKRPSQ